MSLIAGTKAARIGENDDRGGARRGERAVGIRARAVGSAWA
jgi:hypothetical protein